MCSLLVAAPCDAAVEEAPLEEVGSGRAPASDGWFVANVREAAWIVNGAFGARCVFEARGPVLRARPELVPRTFPQVGLTLQVVEPGRPTGLYHAETAQEGALVLAGECLLLVEEEERRLVRFDFVHF